MQNGEAVVTDRNAEVREVLIAEVNRLMDIVDGDITAFGTISIDVPFQKGYFQSVKAGMVKQIRPGKK